MKDVMFNQRYVVFYNKRFIFLFQVKYLFDVLPLNLFKISCKSLGNLLTFHLNEKCCPKMSPATSAVLLSAN